MINLRSLWVILAGCLCCCFFGNGRGSLVWADSVYNELSKLQFHNEGVVTGDMKFGYRKQKCYYVETPNEWSCRAGWKTDHSSYPYLYVIESGEPNAREPDYVVPPTGMRSAVPLGGLGAGTVELRADGGFRDWNIFNNSPGGGGGKVHLDEALFGLRVEPEDGGVKSWPLRTHPPANLPGIERIEYAGAYPISRLCFRDEHLPVVVDLYAYSDIRIREAEASAAPAVIFTFDCFNPSEKAVEVWVMFNLPNHIKGRFAIDNGLVLNRSGQEAVSGSMALRFEKKLPFTCMVSNQLSEIWRCFEKEGDFGSSKVGQEGKYGAVATHFRLEAEQRRSVSFVLSWYFPSRAISGGKEIVGNYYTKLYGSASEVADKVLGRLDETIVAIKQWHRLCFDNNLPVWLQDALVNSLGTIPKTSFWTADGRWRQWESFSCPAIEPIHIHFYRSLPYVLFFPELQRSQYCGFAKCQMEDGFVQENLGRSGGKLDHPYGRVMGDCGTTFIIGVYKHYLWTSNKGYLDKLWPNVKKVVGWQISRCEPFGLPRNCNNTYDWWEFDKKDVVSYNAFCHLAALRAAEELAKIGADSDFATLCRTNYRGSRDKVDELLWTGEYYRSWWAADGNYPDALHADTLYGQLWANILGLGWLVEPDKLCSHLAAEKKYNDSAYGLKVMQRTGDDVYWREELVWQAGSLSWCALGLYLGNPVESCMAEAEKVIDTWRVYLCDQWDWRDLTTVWDGQPWCNSHYGRQLIFWSIPLALSGQRYNAVEKTLSFAPRVKPPAKLPWFVPTAKGTLQLRPDGVCELMVLSGQLQLDKLYINGRKITGRISLQAGQHIEMR